MANVALNWNTHRFKVETTTREIMKELSYIDLEKSVYVIRLAGNFVIQYPRDISPVLYIGQGKFQNRINSHLA